MTRVTRVSSSTAFPRREFLKAGGALLIGFAASPRVSAQQADLLPGDLAPGPAQPDPDQIDTWIAIHADNSATVFIGHVDLGQGIATTMLQIAAEELDLGMDQVKTVRLETGKGPNQGNTGASSGRCDCGSRWRRPRRGGVAADGLDAPGRAGRSTDGGAWGHCPWLGTPRHR
jgi:hypothetical protein